MLYAKSIDGAMREVCGRLLVAAEGRGMKAVGVHSMKWNPDASDTGRAAECRIYEFCDVAQLRRLLEQSLVAAAALPCRVALYKQGAGVRIVALRPRALFAELSHQFVGSEAVDATERALIGAIDEACSARPGARSAAPPTGRGSSGPNANPNGP